ncbi:MAG: TRAP transporter substrate-binding protein [Chloroflexi bacterium]|nr:TRAP transporter substrate-binding protein [Chloroflexota bacterium]
MRATALVTILVLVLTACGGTAPAAPPAPAGGAQPAVKATAPAPAQPAATSQPGAAGPTAAAGKPAAAQFQYRLGINTTLQHPNGVFSDTFKREVEKNSNGRISVQLFPNSQLGAEAEMVNAIKTGDLDLCACTSALVAILSPALQLGDLPFLFPDYATARKVLDGDPGQSVLKTLEAQGVKGLAFGEIGFRGLLNNRKPVDTIADIRGMKVRVVENPLYVATWRAVGANPVPMAWPEVYTGLQQGTIDGVDTNYAGMIDAKQYEVAKHLAVTNHNYTTSSLVMNLAKFNALPQDLRKVVEDAAKVGGAESRKTAEMIDGGAVDTMQKQGVAVTKPPREAFVTAMKTVYDEFAPKIGPDIIAKAQAMMGTR